MAFLQQPSMAQPPPIRSSQPSDAPESQSAFFSQRSRRQLGLFFVGAGFVAASAAITRRSLVKRYKASIPRFYQPSNRPNTEVSGAFEAFEALNIATVNVVSAAIMVSGGLLWALDISSVEDMRKKVRKRIGAVGSDEDKDAEEEIEEWVASMLSRKEFKHLKSMEGKKDEEEKKS